MILSDYIEIVKACNATCVEICQRETIPLDGVAMKTFINAEYLRLNALEKITKELENDK